MSFSYDRYERQQRRRTTQSNRSTLGYWLPLAVSVTIATVGLATWIWNERREGGTDSDDSDDFYYYDDRREDRKRRTQTRPQDGPYSYTPPGGPAPGYQEDSNMAQTSYSQQSTDFQSSTIERREEDVEQNSSIVTRLNDAMRRTPSPQQLFDNASRRVTAGVAAAGAVVGKGFSALTEPKDDFLEHNRWEEEAETRAKDTTVAASSGAQGFGAAVASVVGSATSQVRNAIGQSGQPRKRGRLIVIVVSAASDGEHSGEDSTIDHASILSHIPTDAESDQVELLILIYAPQLTAHPLSSSANQGMRPIQKSSSMGSFSNISAPDDDADESGPQTSLASSSLNPNPSNALYDALQTRAGTLTTHPTHILPFTTPTGHVHLLKHLSPSLVYLQESLCGVQGEIVAQISGWVGQVVVVVGAEGLGGGLVDTETEAETEDESARIKLNQGRSRRDKWWMDETRVGLGKGIEVVESMRLEEDWSKRVGV